MTSTPLSPPQAEPTPKDTGQEPQDPPHRGTERFLLPAPLPATLQELRQLIDLIDEDLVALLNQRAKVSLAVGELKKNENLPVWQPKREQQLLKKITRMPADTIPAAHLVAIFKEILFSSKALQREEVVGYLGPEGTYSHQACASIFANSAATRPFTSIAQLVDGLEQQHCDYAVIPIENSLYGTVSESFDQLLQHRAIHIVAEHVERIQLAALSLEPSLSAITTVFSHPQALGQCAAWLKSMVPAAKIIPVDSTAAAALKTAATPQSLAIGHKKMGFANDLPLKILAENIEDSPNNWTRFFVLRRLEGSHAPVAEADKSTLTFSVADNPGSLAHVLNVFAKSNANLSKLESRPSRTGTWKYVFFADVNCNVYAPEYATMLEELTTYCHDIRILGAYTGFPRPKDQL